MGEASTTKIVDEYNAARLRREVASFLSMVKEVKEMRALFSKAG